jgi:phosphoglycolate phosphatase
LLAIRLAGGDALRAVMVGDSAADVGAARAAGIPVVLVPHGYGARDIRELGADRIVADAAELRAAIAALAGPPGG